LNNAIARMAALAPGDRITIQMVDQEIDKLRLSWARPSTSNGGEVDLLVEYVSQAQLNNMDLHDQLQLAAVLQVCRESRNLSEAGRKLFNISRDQRQKGNDSDRLSKYLKRYNIDPKQIFDRR
jgi:transcriptional regulatory protein RtcR